MSNLPTAMELWFEGSYLGRAGVCDIFRKGERFYRVEPDIERVTEIPDLCLQIMAGGM